MAFGGVDGALDYYFIDGPTPKDVVQRYTELTGRIPLPPMWALGYQQSRYSYFPEARVRNLALLNRWFQLRATRGRSTL